MFTEALCCAVLGVSMTQSNAHPATMDDETKVLMEQFRALNQPPLETQEISVLREMIDNLADVSTVELGSIQTIQISGPVGEIPLRLYKPDGKGPFPVLLSYHGGGWVFGSLKSNDALCRQIAKQAHVIVVSVDYHLAPEHKFPVPLEDCYAALEWVFNNIHKYEGDPARIAVEGDSAGGNLAAAVTLMSKDRKGPTVASQVLIYPVTRFGFDDDSFQRYQEGFVLTKVQMEWFWNLYLNNPGEGKNPYASPYFANLAALPPALIILADFDPLFDQGMEYGLKLKKRGVPVTIKTFPTIHINISNEAINSIEQFLKITLKK